RGGPLEQVERGGLGAGTGRAFLALAPASPPGARSPEGRVLQRQPRQGLELVARMGAEVGVEARLAAVSRRWQCEHDDPGPALLELLAEREDGLEEVRPDPDIRVRSDDRLAIHPVDAVEVGNRAALGLPAPQAAHGHRREALLVALERL